jgi:uroporphyrinogen decarboxylase
VDIIRVLDDYGTQRGLLIGPQRWRSFIKPELARIVAAAKAGGALFWLHSCGYVMDILPDLVDIGIDILDPVQVMANDQAEAKRLYGDKLCLMGGMDTQRVLTLGRWLHFGTRHLDHHAGSELPGLSGGRCALWPLPALG